MHENVYLINSIELKIEKTFLKLRVHINRKHNFNSQVILTVNKANGVFYFIKY